MALDGLAPAKALLLHALLNDAASRTEKVRELGTYHVLECVDEAQAVLIAKDRRAGYCAPDRPEVPRGAAARHRLKTSSQIQQMAPQRLRYAPFIVPPERSRVSRASKTSQSPSRSTTHTTVNHTSQYVHWSDGAA